MKTFSRAGALLALAVSVATAALADTPGVSTAHAPDAALASSFIGSGGGAGSFSSVRAFDNMIGSDAVLATQRDLSKRYGKRDASQFFAVFAFAVSDAWTAASLSDVKLPAAPESSGTTAEARQLVREGMGPNRTFHFARLFGDLFTVPVATRVMNDVDTRFGDGTAGTFRRMADRFFYDVGADVNLNAVLAPNA